MEWNDGCTLANSWLRVYIAGVVICRYDSRYIRIYRYKVHILCRVTNITNLAARKGAFPITCIAHAECNSCVYYQRYMLQVVLSRYIRAHRHNDLMYRVINAFVTSGSELFLPRALHLQSETDTAFDRLYEIQVRRSRYIKAYRYLLYRVINIGFVASRTAKGTNHAAEDFAPHPTELLPFPSLALPPLPPFPSLIESNQRAGAVLFEELVLLLSWRWIWICGSPRWRKGSTCKRMSSSCSANT